MKRYVFELVILESRDDFWDSIAGKAGCDEVKEAIATTLDDHGWLADGECGTLTLKSFSDSGPEKQ